MPYFDFHLFRMPYFDRWLRVRLEGPRNVTLVAVDGDNQLMGVLVATILSRLTIVVLVATILSRLTIVVLLVTILSRLTIGVLLDTML